ncbi:MAG: glycosyltransferase family protein [Planctomycetota bacterium]|jgi:glycosyltransferase involved in cell wall biosynthesis
MSEPLRLLGLADDPEGPSTRYRLSQFAPALAAQGITLELAQVPRGMRARSAFFRALPAHDCVVLQRVLLAAGEIKRLRKGARRLIYDFDDALPYRTPAQGGGRSSRRSARFRRLCAAADAVVAGNTVLARLAHDFARSVRVIPTVVDPSRYPERTPPDRSGVLVWIGQPPTLPYLEALIPALRLVAERTPGTVLRCIGAEPSVELRAIPGMRLEARAWSSETEVAELQQGTLGLAPLSDDDWSRGKCGLRLIQYLAAGVPAIASPVGVQGEIVTAGGAWGASSDAQWAESMSNLLSCAPDRQQLAREGLRLVREGFSVDHAAPLLAGAVREVVRLGARNRT